MMTVALRNGLIFAGVVLLAVAAGGQVVPTQTGRELDANYRHGSGGLNTPGVEPAGINSQLYVTGQVTGLGAFRGGVGYRAPDQLGLDLPSAALSQFRRQSVGLEDVGAGSLYRPAPYYERSTTVLGLREIQSGAALPGSSIPRRSMIPPALAEELYVDATAAYRPLAPAPAAVRTPAVGSLVRTPESAADTREPRLPFGAYGGVDLFRVADVDSREQLARELRELRFGEARIDREVKAEVDASTAGPAPSLQDRTELRPAAPAPEGAQVLTGPVAPAAQTYRALIAQPNEDVYLDLLLLMREQSSKRRSQRPPADDVGVFRLDESAESLRPADEPAPPARKPAGKSADLVDIARDNRIVLHGLAGRSADAFNNHMNQAKRSLSEGKYYEAALEYQLAMTIDSRNPLARIGRGLALFAAGESLSAAINIRRAMELFPPIMETRLDVPMIMDPVAFDHQLDRVDERLAKEAREADPLLIFLGTYAHYSVGNLRIAKYYARKLHAAAGSDDALFRAYATFVLTGDRPAEQAATRPAP